MLMVVVAADGSKVLYLLLVRQNNHNAFGCLMILCDHQWLIPINKMHDLIKCYHVGG